MIARFLGYILALAICSFFIALFSYGTVKLFTLTMETLR